MLKPCIPKRIQKCFLNLKLSKLKTLNLNRNSKLNVYTINDQTKFYYKLSYKFLNILIPINCY
jgi:hypothetical protein